ncbi:MAG: DUF1854 domain-containing protein [Verrucomicrobiales bacterium]
MLAPFSLTYRGAHVFATDDDHPEGVAVQLAYAQPLSHRGRGISIIEASSKNELFWLDTIDELPQPSQEVAASALNDRYRIAVIQSVTDSQVNHGHRYLKVETDRGARYFNLREPGKNVSYVTGDHLIIRDSMGNRYEIPALKMLDPESRERLDRVL